MLTDLEAARTQLAELEGEHQRDQDTATLVEAAARAGAAEGLGHRAVLRPFDVRAAMLRHQDRYVSERDLAGLIGGRFTLRAGAVCVTLTPDQLAEREAVRIRAWAVQLDQCADLAYLHRRLTGDVAGDDARARRERPPRRRLTRADLEREVHALDHR